MIQHSIFTFLLLKLCLILRGEARTLFVVLDGFRFDYVKLFDTPNIEGILEASNAFFHPGVSPIFPSTTLPNLASMISGNYSDTHGIPSYTPKTNLSPSNREYWSRLREMGTIWDSYISSSESTNKAPGLIGWPFSTLIDSDKKQRFRHLPALRNLTQKSSQIRQLFRNESLDFVSIYVDEPGTYAIPYGPESKQVNESIVRLDAWIGDIVREYKEDTNIIIASTPGYQNASLSNVIYLSKILDKGMYSVHGNSPFLSIIPKEGEEINVFETLDQQKDFKTYYKNKIPPKWHYKLDPRVKLVLLASDGKVFEDFFKKVKTFQTQNKIKEPLERTYGLNGYANSMEISRSILLGVGPAFVNEDKESVPSSFPERTGARTIDIYALLCHVLKVENKSTSDREGKLEPFLQDLSSPPIEALEKIKKVFKRITNTPAAGAIGSIAIMVLFLFACAMICYRRKSKKLDQSYSYTQIRDNRRGGDSETQEEEFEKVEFLGIDEEFHEASEDLLSKGEEKKSADPGAI